MTQPKRRFYNIIAVSFLLVALGGLLAGCTFTFFPKQSGGTFNNNNNNSSDTYEYHDRWNWNNNNPYTPGGGGGGYPGGNAWVSWASDFTCPIQIRNYPGIDSCGINIPGFGDFNLATNKFNDLSNRHSYIPAERIVSSFGWRKIFTAEDAKYDNSPYSTGKTMNPFQPLTDGLSENYYGMDLDTAEGEGIADAFKIEKESLFNGEKTQNVMMSPKTRNDANRIDGGFLTNVVSHWRPRTQVYAVADGTVVEVGNIESDNPYEEAYVVIRHDNPLPGYGTTYTRYSGLYGATKITDQELIDKYFTHPFELIPPGYGPCGFYYNNTFFTWMGNPLVMDINNASMAFPKIVQNSLSVNPSMLVNPFASIDLKNRALDQIKGNTSMELWIPSSVFNPFMWNYHFQRGLAPFAPNPFIGMNSIIGHKVKRGDFIAYAGGGLLDPGGGQRGFFMNTLHELGYQIAASIDFGSFGASFKAGGGAGYGGVVSVPPGHNSYTQRHLKFEVHAFASDWSLGSFLPSSPTERGTAINPRSWFTIEDAQNSGFPYQHIPGQNRAYEHAFHIPTSFEKDSFGNVFLRVKNRVGGVLGELETVKNYLFKAGDGKGGNGGGLNDVLSGGNGNPPPTLVTAGVYRIPDGTNDIMANAFSGLDFSQVTRIEIPASVTDIGSYSFGFLSKMPNPPPLYFDDPTKIRSLGDESFANVQNLKLVDNSLGSPTPINFDAFVNLNYIGRSAFERATFDTSLAAYAARELRLPTNLLYVGDRSFASVEIITNKFQGDLDIPATVKGIGKGSFAGNDFTDLKFHGSNLVTIGEGAFKDCKVSYLALPASVKHIGSEAFLNNTLTHFNLPELNNLETIGRSAFTGKNNPADIRGNDIQTFRDGPNNYVNYAIDFTKNPMLRQIGDYAFSNNRDIREIKMPSVSEFGTSFEWLGAGAFHNTMALHNSVSTLADFANYLTYNSPEVAEAMMMANLASNVYKGNGVANGIIYVDGWAVDVMGEKYGGTYGPPGGPWLTLSYDRETGRFDATYAGHGWEANIFVNFKGGRPSLDSIKDKFKGIGDWFPKIDFSALGRPDWDWGEWGDWNNWDDWDWDGFDWGEWGDWGDWDFDFGDWDIKFWNGARGMADSLFKGIKNILNIDFNPSLNIGLSFPRISNFAFDGSSLKTFIEEIGNIAKIGYGAFRDCVQLTYVFIKENIAHPLYEILEETFKGCVQLASVVMTQIKEIGRSAFQGCVDLGKYVGDAVSGYFSDIKFGSVEKLGDGAFAGVKELGREMYGKISEFYKDVEKWFGESLTSVGHYVFDATGYLMLQMAKIENGVIAAGQWAIGIVDGWFGDIMFSETVMHIASGALSLVNTLFDYGISVDYMGCLKFFAPKVTMYAHQVQNMGQDALKGWNRTQQVVVKTNETSVDWIYNDIGKKGGGSPEIIIETND